MPNWCLNEERIVGSRKEVISFFHKLAAWTSKTYVENGCGCLWLGNILLGAGFEMDNELRLKCRGSFVDEPRLHDDGEEVIHISFTSMTVWRPMNEIWDMVLKLHAPNCKHIFRSVESGMGYFVTNDGDGCFFPEDFFVDCYMDDPASIPKQLRNIKGTTCEDDMLFILQSFLHTDSKDVGKLVDRFNQMADEGAFGERNFIRIYRFQLDNE